MTDCELICIHSYSIVGINQIVYLCQKKMWQSTRPNAEYIAQCSAEVSFVFLITWHFSSATLFALQIQDHAVLFGVNIIY